MKRPYILLSLSRLSFYLLSCPHPIEPKINFSNHQHPFVTVVNNNLTQIDSSPSFIHNTWQFPLAALFALNLTPSVCLSHPLVAHILSFVCLIEYCTSLISLWIPLIVFSRLLLNSWRTVVPDCGYWWLQVIVGRIQKSDNLYLRTNIQQGRATGHSHAEASLLWHPSHPSHLHWLPCQYTTTSPRGQHSFIISCCCH